MQITVIRLRTILLIGVLPPVDALTLLLPYPPKAGNAMKHPPTMLAIPRATNSRLADSETPCRPSPGLLPPVPRDFAATEDSKKPSSAIKKEVLIAARTCFMKDGTSGQWNGKGLPVLDWTFPSTWRPSLSQPNFQVNTAERTTTTKRSGM